MTAVAPTTITAVAPIRIADVGGWTDTWFARHGSVCNLAVYPYAEVQLNLRPRSDDAPRIRIHAENVGLRFDIDDLARAYDKLPLFEAALRRIGVPERVSLDVSIFCEVPPGASTGTSAAVSVASIAALAELAGATHTPYEIARLAHAIESEDLGLQSGVQDQLCSAFGGINLIEITQFPHACVTPISVPQSSWWELERRLILVYVGRPHQSSAIHQQVIRHLDGHGAGAADHPLLQRLRQLAGQAKDALYRGDWPALGAVWQANTQAQRDLHPGLVSSDFERVLAIAAEHGCLGGKVNGAGGDGGSVTLLAPARADAKRACTSALSSAGFIVIPVYLARQGLRVWRGG